MLRILPTVLALALALPGGLAGVLYRCEGTRAPHASCAMRARAPVPEGPQESSLAPAPHCTRIASSADVALRETQETRQLDGRLVSTPARVAAISLVAPTDPGVRLERAQGPPAAAPPLYLQHSSFLI